MSVGVDYTRANASNYKNYLDLSATDLDSDASDTWYLQGNYDTAATAVSPEQLEAIQNGGITNYHISDPSINPEKTYSFDEAMGTVKTDDIKIKSDDLAKVEMWQSIDSAATTVVGGVLGGIVGGGAGVGIGMGTGASTGNVANGFIGKGASKAQRDQQEDIDERKADVKSNWIADVLAGNNDDYYITDVKKDGNKYIDGTIRAKQKPVVLTGYGNKGVSSSGIGM